MRLSPSHGSCCTNDAVATCRAALRPKNVAGEYGQLRQDFKTSDTPGCYRRTGFGVGHALSKGDPERAVAPVRLSGSSQTQVPGCDTTGASFHGATVPGYASSRGQRRVRHPLGASRRRPGRPGSARHTVRAVRSPRLLRRARWRHPRPRSAPGRPGRTGRPRRRPTTPRRRRGNDARVARFIEARCSYARCRHDCRQYWRRRPIPTSVTSRPHQRHGCGWARRLTPADFSRAAATAYPGIMSGRVACTACRPGNYAGRRNVCQANRTALQSAGS